MSRPPHLPIQWLCALMAVAAAAAHAQQPLENLQIEDLLKLRVTAATRSAQSLDEAPASVTVITAEEIRKFGYRTLGDAVGSVKGVYLNNDRTYGHIGVRGFARAGDFNSRLLLLVDGNRINDNIYDSATLNTEFPLDIDSVERIEFIPGPASALYGNNAYFGVINVITKAAERGTGAEASVKFDSLRRHSAWAGATFEMAETAKLALDVNFLGGRGPRTYYGAFDAPATNHGIDEGSDHTKGTKLYARYMNGGFSASLMASDRVKGSPGGFNSADFNDPSAFQQDRYRLADAAWRSNLGTNADYSLRAYWGAYDYLSNWPNAQRNRATNRDDQQGRWHGAEARLGWRGLPGHHISAGVDYHRDARISLTNFDVSPYALLAATNNARTKAGAYLQDEWRLAGSILTLGARYDFSSASGESVSPRASWVTPFGEGYVFKTIFGSAFRAANGNESYYTAPTFNPPLKGNTRIKPERIRSLDFVLERSLGGWTASANAYLYRIRDNINQVTDPADNALVFINQGQIKGKGLDLEVRYRWVNGAFIQASFSPQNVRDENGTRTIDSPARTAKLRAALPLRLIAPGNPWLGPATLALDWRTISPRRGERAVVPGHATANLILSGLRLGAGLSMDVGIYNLANQRIEHTNSASFAFNAMPQDGRQVQATLRYVY